MDLCAWGPDRPGPARVPPVRPAEAGVVPVTANGLFQLLLYLLVLIALAKPLGWFMARVYQGKPCGLDRVLGPIERLFYRIAGVRSDAEMGWKAYAIAVLLFNAVGFLAVYAMQRLQGSLPL